MDKEDISTRSLYGGKGEKRETTSTIAPFLSQTLEKNYWSRGGFMFHFIKRPTPTTAAAIFFLLWDFPLKSEKMANYFKYLTIMQQY